MNESGAAGDYEKRAGLKKGPLFVVLFLLLLLLAFQAYIYFGKFIPEALSSLSAYPDIQHQVASMFWILVRMPVPWIGASFGLLIGQIIAVYRNERSSK